MIIGWDSETDTFFISGMSEPEAAALQGTIASLVEGLDKNVVPLGPCRLSDLQYLDFLDNLQNGLFRGYEVRQEIKGS